MEKIEKINLINYKKITFESENISYELIFILTTVFAKVNKNYFNSLNRYIWEVLKCLCGQLRQRLYPKAWT